MGSTRNSISSLTNADQHDPSGDEQLRAYAHELLQLARARLNGHIRRKEDPEDVVQSAFKSFFRLRNAGRLDLSGKHDLLGLLVVITRRKCEKRLRNYRRAKRDVQREARRVAGGDDSVSGLPATGAATPEEAAILVELIEKAAAGFESQENRILTMALEGHTQREIAADVKLSERTVRRVLQRVKRRLGMLDSEQDSAE
jgi:RNA polymerase sigma-70 factor, ECF subfamily